MRRVRLLSVGSGVALAGVVASIFPDGGPASIKAPRALLNDGYVILVADQAQSSGPPHEVPFSCMRDPTCARLLEDYQDKKNTSDGAKAAYATAATEALAAARSEPGFVDSLESAAENLNAVGQAITSLQNTYSSNAAKAFADGLKNLQTEAAPDQIRKVYEDSRSLNLDPTNILTAEIAQIKALTQRLEQLTESNKTGTISLDALKAFVTAGKSTDLTGKHAASKRAANAADNALTKVCQAGATLKECLVASPPVQKPASNEPIKIIKAVYGRLTEDKGKIAEKEKGAEQGKSKQREKDKEKMADEKAQQPQLAPYQCDATGYFKRECEYAPYDFKICRHKKDGKITVCEGKVTSEDFDITPRTGYAPISSDYCAVKIDLLQICGGHNPYYSDGRKAEVIWRCGTGKETTKRYGDGEIAHLFCPNK